MKSYTAQRTFSSGDEIWLVEHPPVYTLGLAASRMHFLNPSLSIPVIKTDRGGQVTFHGPGQVILYLLVDLKRRALFVRRFVYLIEQAVIDCLAEYDIISERRAGAPGVYIKSRHSQQKTLDYGGAKIASIGLKISRGCSYHGVSLNVDMDLNPFYEINPCGFANLRVVDMKMMGFKRNTLDVGLNLAEKLILSLHRHGKMSSY